jgi:hypothetical protein
VLDADLEHTLQNCNGMLGNKLLESYKESRLKREASADSREAIEIMTLALVPCFQEVIAAGQRAMTSNTNMWGTHILSTFPPNANHTL